MENEPGIAFDACQLELKSKLIEREIWTLQNKSGKVLWCEVKVELPRAGPETGYLREITLSDGSKANVTVGHTMLVEAFSELEGIMKNQKTLASDVRVGDRMNTTNGKQFVTSINTFPVEDKIVYNFKLALPPTSDVLSRVDLHAQELLAPWWQRTAAHLIHFVNVICLHDNKFRVLKGRLRVTLERTNYWNTFVLNFKEMNSIIIINRNIWLSL